MSTNERTQRTSGKKDKRRWSLTHNLRSFRRVSHLHVVFNGVSEEPNVSAGTSIQGFRR